MKKTMKLLALTLVLALALSLAACANRNTYSAAKSANADVIDLDKAKQIAYDDAGATEEQAVDKDYELEDGVYEIDFQVGDMEYEYKISAADGKILRADKEPDTRDDTVADRPEYIGLEKAKQIAYAHAGVVEADAFDKDYDLENGVYEIEFQLGNTEYDYKIRATDGKILHCHNEPGHHDDDHHDAYVADRSDYIGLEKAKSIAYQNAGVDEAKAFDKDYDLEKGVYDIEFTFDGMEYDYKIDARTGEILRAKKEIDD